MKEEASWRWCYVNIIFKLVYINTLTKENIEKNTQILAEIFLNQILWFRAKKNSQVSDTWAPLT